MPKSRLNHRILIALSPLLIWAESASAVTEPPVLRAPLEAEPITLDWARAKQPQERFLVSFLMRGLLKYAGSGQPVCDLCREFSVSKDLLSYRFELQPGLKWSDGKGLEARHFVDAFERLRRLEKDLELVRVLESANAVSSGTLVLVLRKPTVLFPHWLTLGHAFPVRKDLLGADRDPTGERMATQATLGPYTLVAWEKKSRIVIEGNPEYAGLRPVYRVDFALGSHASLFARFRSGRLDLLSNPTTEDLVALGSRNVQVNPYWATRALVFRSNRKAVASTALRRAILYSLDRAALPAALKNGERPTAGLIPPGLFGARSVPLVTRDLNRARTEMERAGGATAVADPIAIQVGPHETDRRTFEWLQAQTTPLGIRWKSVSGPDWDVSLQTTLFEVASALDILRRFRTGDPANTVGWTSVAYDALLSQLLENHSTAGAPGTLYDEAAQILEVQDPVVIPLSHPSQPFVLGPRVKAFAITPYGDPDLVKIQF